LIISFFVFSNKSPTNNTRRPIKDTKDAENMDYDRKVTKIIEINLFGWGVKRQTTPIFGLVSNSLAN